MMVDILVYFVLPGLMLLWSIADKRQFWSGVWAVMLIWNLTDWLNV